MCGVNISIWTRRNKWLFSHWWCSEEEHFSSRTFLFHPPIFNLFLPSLFYLSFSLFFHLLFYYISFPLHIHLAVFFFAPSQIFPSLFMLGFIHLPCSLCLPNRCFCYRRPKPVHHSGCVHRWGNRSPHLSGDLLRGQRKVGSKKASYHKMGYKCCAA